MGQGKVDCDDAQGGHLQAAGNRHLHLDCRSSTSYALHTVQNAKPDLGASLVSYFAAVRSYPLDMDLSRASLSENAPRR
jgi:hypothetical protein